MQEEDKLLLKLKINQLKILIGKVNWVKCPKCKEDYTALCDNGICSPCNEIQRKLNLPKPVETEKERKMRELNNL